MKSAMNCAYLSVMTPPSHAIHNIRRATEFLTETEILWAATFPPAENLIQTQRR